MNVLYVCLKSTYSTHHKKVGAIITVIIPFTLKYKHLAWSIFSPGLMDYKLFLYYTIGHVQTQHKKANDFILWKFPLGFL